MAMRPKVPGRNLEDGVHGDSYREGLIFTAASSALSLISELSKQKPIQTHQFNFSTTTGPETGCVTPRSAEISSKRSLTVFK